MRQDKQTQEETFQPHPEECEEPAPRQKRQSVRTSDNLYDVSDDEVHLSDTNHPKAKAKSKRFGIYMDEKQKDDWLRESSELDLGLTSWESKPMATRDTDIGPVMKLSGNGNTTPETTPTPLLSPRDILDDMHSLRQHAPKNVEGDILLYGAPAGSIAARNIVPLAYKVKYPRHIPLAHEGLRLKYYQAKLEAVFYKVDGPIQRLDLIEGEILEYRSDIQSENNQEDQKYLLQRGGNPDVVGWASLKHLEAVYDPDLLPVHRKGAEDV